MKVRRRRRNVPYVVQKQTSLSPAKRRTRDSPESLTVWRESSESEMLLNELPDLETWHLGTELSWRGLPCSTSSVASLAIVQCTKYVNSRAVDVLGRYRGGVGERR
jgi:hypothetical protein